MDMEAEQGTLQQAPSTDKQDFPRNGWIAETIEPIEQKEDVSSHVWICMEAFS